MEWNEELGMSGVFNSVNPLFKNNQGRHLREAGGPSPPQKKRKKKRNKRKKRNKKERKKEWNYE